MKDRIMHLLEKFKEDNSYIINNYSVEQRINFINSLEQAFLEFGDNFFEKIGFSEEDADKLFFKLFTNEEAINLLNKKEIIDSNLVLDNVLLSSLNDSSRIILLDNKPLSVSVKTEIIRSLEDSSTKLKYIRKYPDYFRFNIEYIIEREINAVDEDELIETLILFKDDINFSPILLKKLKSSEKIIELLIKVDQIHKIDDYINELKNDEFIIKTLNEIGKKLSSSSMSKFIKQVSDETERINLLVKYFDMYNFSDGVIPILNSLENKETLVLFFNGIIEEPSYTLINIIKKLKNDEAKLKGLECVKNKLSEDEVTQIIISLDDDLIKTKYIFNNKLNKNDLTNLLCSFKEDNKKYSMALEYREFLGLDDFVKIISSMHSDDFKIKLMNGDRFNFAFEQKALIIESIEDIDLKFSLIVSTGLEYKNYGWLETKIEHNDSLLECKTVNYSLLNYYANEYKVKIENLSCLVENYGYIVLRFIKNENIIKILNADKEDFNKVLEIFDNKSLILNESIVGSIYESVVQRIFRNNNPDNVFNLYEILKTYALDSDKYNLKLNLIKIVDSDLINLEEYGVTINELVENLSNEERREIYLEILKNITTDYLIKSRNEYSNSRKKTMYSDLNLNIKYSKKSFVDKIYNLNYIEDILDIIYTIDESVLEEEYKFLLQNKELLIECLVFKKDPQNYKGDFNKIKSYLKPLNGLLELLYEKNYKEISPKLYYSFTSNIEDRVFDVNKISNEKILKIMAEMDINQLKDTLFKNDFLNKELLEILYKYKIIGWDTVFERVFDEANIDYDESMISSMCSYFYKFYPKLLQKKDKGELKNITFLSLLDEASIYGSNSNIYRILLGKEDYSLIVKNPGPNSASLSKDERLKLIPEKLKTMYDRKYITIPPVEETFTLDENKKLCVSVGNVVDTMNLTYGERTGACMRIGGVGYSLFQFCLQNENGVHIKITDPETNALVSRVSGFRNGNCVFLNQLRNSLDTKYKEQDLVNVVTEISKILIEKSKDSKYPIDNVIISDGYAMSTKSQEKIKLEKQVKEGFDYFYSDVSDTNAILLASSNESNKLVELDLGPEKCERYEVMRSKILKTNSKDEIYRNITKLKYINNLLSQNELDENYVLDVSNIETLIYGEDWFIALDINNNIIEEFYINRGLSKTQEEMEFIKNTLGTNSIDLENGGLRL